MANGATRAEVRYDHWNAILDFHCTRHGTTFGTDGAKGGVGETKPSLDDRDFGYSLRGRGRRRASSRFFARRSSAIGRCAEGAADHREQMESGETGVHGILAVERRRWFSKLKLKPMDSIPSSLKAVNLC